MSAGVLARGADMSFREFTVKITDRKCRQGDVNDVMHRKRAREIWGDLKKKSVSWVPAWEEEGWLSGLVVARRICALRAPRVNWFESWRCKSSQHRKIVSLSRYVEKPFNSKIIKSFVPELSRQVFFVFRDSYVIYKCVMDSYVIYKCVMDSYVIYKCVMDIMNVSRNSINMSISRILEWLWNIMICWKE